MDDKERKRIWNERQKQIEKKFGSESDYHDQLAALAPRKPHVSAYKCQAGCLHIEYESVMLSLSEEHFNELSNVIISLRNALMIEKMQKEDEEYVFGGLM